MTKNLDVVAPHAWSGIKQIGDDQFETEKVDPFRDGRFYGGHLVSQALYCAYRTVLPDFDVNSFHSYFVKAGNGQLPITFKVRRLRDGRNFVFRSVQLFQSDTQLIYHCEFTFRKRPDKSDLKITDARFPNVPGPERVANAAELQVEFRRRGHSKLAPHGIAFPEIYHNIEIRPCNGMEYLLGPQRPTMKQNIWVRYRPEATGADERVQRCLAVAFISDIGLAFTGARVFAQSKFQVLSSLDHSGWMHDMNFDPHDFLLFEQECLIHSQGISLVHGRLWTRTGELIASFSQESIIEPVRPLTTEKSKL